MSAQPEQIRGSETVAAWHVTLGEIAHLGDLLVAAIERDDLITTIATMMQLRRARIALQRIDAASTTTTDLTREQLASVRTAVAQSKSVDAIMAQWLARPLPADAQLLESPIGIAVLADTLLPVAWDFERDLVVLVGDEYAPVAHILADLGQARIAFVGSGDVPPQAIVIKDDTELQRAMTTMAPMSPTQLALRSGASADQELVKKLSAVGRDGLADLRIQQNTIVNFGRLWIDQGTRNLPAIAKYPTIDAVGEAFAGKPMVIVAPGPSLAKNIEQLRELQGKALICCFSHSLKPVVAAGITPDIIVTADPQDVRYHFGDADLSGSFLVNAATVHPTLYELPARGMFSMAANGPIDEWIFDVLRERTPELIGGGSVATSAFTLGLRWKCDPIMFIGLDLSFPGGKYYVSTSSDGDAHAELRSDGTMEVAGWSKGFREMKAKGGPPAVAERVVELPGWGGGTVPSSFMFSMFRRWFISAVEQFPERRILNCTEGGCFIDGMQHVPFAEAKASLDSSVDARAILDAAVAHVDQLQRRRSVVKGLDANLTHLKRVRQLANRARDMIASEVSERELQRVERILSDALAPISFLGLLAQRELDKAIAVAAHDADTETYLAASSRLFATLIRVVDDVAPYLRAAHERMK